MEEKKNFGAADIHESDDEGKYTDESDDEDNLIVYKIVLLGDGAVGKTSIATRFSQDQFMQSYKQTIGLDFFVKHLILPGEAKVTLQLWDIGGQSIGSRLLRNYIYGAHAVLLCYDITSYQSFQNLEDWYRLMQQVFVDAKLPYVGLLANKSDLHHLSAVSKERHQAFADENDLYSFTISAKTGDGVSACFHRVSSDLSGIFISRPEVEVTNQVVKAEVVEYHQNEPNTISNEKTPSAHKCSIQ